jgi:hypothetical protein
VGDQLDLAAQIRKLRMEMFLTRLVGGLLLIILAVFVLLGRKQRLTTVEATEFVLKDDAGNVFGRLAKQGVGGACLTLMAKGSEASSRLCSEDGLGVGHSSYMILYDGDGISRVSLSTGDASNSNTRIESGLYLVSSPLGRKFMNLNLGLNTELTIGREQIARFVEGSEYVQQSFERTAVISIPEEKPAIELFDKSGRKVSSTQRK